MTAITIDEQIVRYAVYGGAILGGGGGGWIKEGLELGRLALEAGDPRLLTVDELSDEDLLVTVAMVGAPAAKDQYVKPIQYARALELLQERTGRTFRGIITNENGAGTTVNGWFQAALTGIPVIDNPCNGRAHPTGVMGALNLSELPDYVSHQAAVGGKGANLVELTVSGSLSKAASLVRSASVEAGGLVAVARNPVTVSYAKKNGAPGAIVQAIEVGEALLSHKGEAAIDAVAAKLGGKLVTVGEVSDFRMETAGGFDVGTVLIGGYEMTFWNEYMTLEKDGERLSTFPDLIMTLDADTAEPVVSAAVAKEQRLAVISVPKQNLKLSTTMSNKNLLKPIEPIVHKPIEAYL
ncbi:hypothetical protein B7C51_17265 [Paenibacillus larvae subsp. pulvifaciens]|uniref:OsrF n=2 Tax=Paenibacillus larvae TaxID=1464 RepID=A0A1V0UVX6_9BACL|nr:DUF917 family protein [Paenibacillus larvae]ARF69188.1 hypothetical protein B7C51_17265 [Paenibacillus larvae subsp. pulvifaciens]QHZ50288.1 hypothetical protein ERICV_01115 [Paenibacillus larvae subsp. larvae]